jgi:hypothetical protein
VPVPFLSGDTEKKEEKQADERPDAWFLVGLHGKSTANSKQTFRFTPLTFENGNSSISIGPKNHGIA